MTDGEEEEVCTFVKQEHNAIRIDAHRFIPRTDDVFNYATKWREYDYHCYVTLIAELSDYVKSKCVSGIRPISLHESS